MEHYIERKRELALLEERYHSDQFEFGYLYGQRRIGKTTLMEMFRKGKKALMFFATDSADIDIRNSFSNTLCSATGTAYNGTFSDWYTFFEAIDSYFGDESGLMVIDEYPNIVLTRDGKKKSTDFSSSLQKAIDLLFKHRKFLLVLTGSNVSFMKHEIPNSKAPLYQRNTFSMVLKKFEWDEAVQALSDVHDNMEKAKILALTNTFPYYLSLIDRKKTADENIRKLFYSRMALFTDDPSKIITTSIASGGLYASVLNCVSAGKNTMKQLCESLETDSSKMSKYLAELIDHDVLRKRKNFNSLRKVTYEICDPMLAFYHRFIRENAEMIKTGYGDLIKKEQQNAIQAFVEKWFENECITYLEYLNKQGKLNALYLDFENGQIDNTSLGRSIELDIAASRNNCLLTAECKFSKKKRTLKDYNDMKEDISVPPFSLYESKELYLFGSSGFDDRLKGLKDNDLHLIDLSVMFQESN